MPQVKTLVGGSKASAIQGAATPTAPAPTGETSIALPPNLPGFLATLPPLPEVSDRQTGTYVAFAHPMSPSWGMQNSAGCRQDQPYLSMDGQIVPLNPCRFWLVASAGFSTKATPQGAFTKAKRGIDAPGLDTHYVGLVIVDTPHGLVPARIDARATRSNVVGEVVKAVMDAAEPGWAQKGDAQRVAAAFPVPFGRVIGTVVNGETRISKVSGNRYTPSSATAAPAGAKDLERLAAAFGDPEFMAALEAAKSGFDARVAQIERACDATAAA